MTCECISANERKQESITYLKDNILLNVVFRRVSSVVPKSGGNFLFRTLGFFCFFLYLKKYLAALCGIWDVSSPIRGHTGTPCTGRAESSRHHQGGPRLQLESDRKCDLSTLPLP